MSKGPPTNFFYNIYSKIEKVYNAVNAILTREQTVPYLDSQILGIYLTISYISRKLALVAFFRYSDNTTCFLYKMFLCTDYITTYIHVYII